jgi:PAS domain S-box-containing protein
MPPPSRPALDGSQRGATEPETAADRERLLDFARASGDWMWETDAELRYTWISGAFEPITGQPPDVMIGRQVADAPLLDAFGAPQPGGRSLYSLLHQRMPLTRVLTEKLTPRGRLVISRSAVPVFDANGEFRGWRGTARDMTARLEAANRARTQSELLQQLSAQAPGVIFQFLRRPDGTGRFQLVNERVVDLFGLTTAELMADPARIFAAVHPDDRARLHEAIERHERMVLPLQIEYRVRRPDGSERWMSSTSSPERLADGSIVWRGFVADATERKNIELALRASEERWAMAAEAAGIGIAQADLRSGELHFDERACANHGLPWPHGRYTLDDWLQAIHPSDREAAAGALQHAIAHGGRMEARFRFTRPDGSQPWLEVSAQVRRDAEGHALSAIGTCRDVTGHMATDTLRRDKEAAERASRAKSEFLSRVSHELRTPLNGILGFAQVMALDHAHPLASEQLRRLDGVRRAGRHLLDLINDVLDIARIEQGDFALKPKPVDAAQAVDACLSLIQPLAAARDVCLPPRIGQPCWVRADARALEQVLMNLLSNAIKYNRSSGSVHLELLREGERVTLAVRDEGEGLSEQQQAQLFQPFNRLGAERRRIEGSGLGLVIARQLVEAMGGTLGLTSRRGGGCRFTVTLDAAAPGEEAPGSTPMPLLATGEAAGPRRHVLYIEDEPLNVVLMRELFDGRPEWALHVAADGSQGVALARALQPDLLLVDMNLPDMNGLEVLQQLRSDARTAALPCVALSADAMREQIDAARAAGFDDYWTKPIDVPRLMSMIARTLDGAK